MPPRPNMKRREELLNQLQEIVLAEGFSHLRAGMLAARLRCSRSTLYVLAPSKDELFALVFERIANDAIVQAETIGDAQPTAAEAIVEFVKSISRRQADGSAAFWRDVRDHPLTADVLSEQRARGYRVLKRYMDEGVAAGVFRPAHTDFLAYALWMSARITRDPDLLDKLGLSMEESLDELAKLIVGGLDPRLG